MKGLKEVLVYTLLSIGAIIMLVPFAWMISTSFKLPSEVDKWPPQWGSKNFFSKRLVKVRGGFDAVAESGSSEGSLREALASVAIKRGDNVFTLNVNDDLFYRGELHLLIEGNPRYAKTMPIDEKTRDLINRIEALSSFMRRMGFNTVRLSNYDRMEDFFNDYFTQSIAEFNRLNFVPKVMASLNRYSNLIERNNRGLILLTKRVKNEEDRKELESFLKNLKGNFVLASEKLKMYMKGSRENLSYGEIMDIAKVLEGSLDVRVPNVSDPFAKRIIKIVELKVMNPVEKLVERLKIHDEVVKDYESVQKYTLKGREIVARFTSEDYRIKLLNERLRSNPILKPYLDRIEKVEEMGYDKLTQNFSGLLDRNLAEYLKEHGVGEDLAYQRVSDLRNTISSIMNVLTESGENLEKVISDSDSIDEVKEKLMSILPGSILLKTQLSKLERLIPKGVEAGKFIKRLIDETLAISVLRDIYTNSMSELRIVKAPSIVREVRVKYDKEKYWEVIEIVFDKDVPGVYFRDEDYKAAVFFNFKEVMANVFQNYADAWHAAPFGRYYLNTIFVATATTILEVILASMAAFAFSILRFRGRDLLFGIFVATMMVPGEVLLVPNYITVSKFGWIDTYYALIIPWIVSVFAIFLIRQYFLTLPRELYDAAKIDGCSNWRYLWQIAVPLSKPVIITGALLKFVGSWNAFLWVLIVTNDPKYRTLPVGLYTFRGEAGDIYNQLMAAATFSVLPVIILFLFAQKHFIRGIARTGLK